MTNVELSKTCVIRFNINRIVKNGSGGKDGFKMIDVILIQFFERFSLNICTSEGYFQDLIGEHLQFIKSNKYKSSL